MFDLIYELEYYLNKSYNLCAAIENSFKYSLTREELYEKIKTFPMYLEVI